MNLKTFLNFMKRALLLVVVLTTVSITSCDDDDDGPTVFNGSVYDLITSDQFKQSTSVPADKALDSLVKYLSINPDLVAALETSAEVTLFAPSNQAFINLLTNTPGFPPKISLINPAIIKGVLTYHIVGDKLKKADLTSATDVNTLFPITDPCTGQGTGTFGAIEVNTNGTLLTGSTNKEIDILFADNEATNGYVQVVESVMIPPTVGDALTPILGKLSATVSLGASFTHLNTLMRKADCVTANAAERISTILSGNGPYTMFLIPNAVFEGAAAQAGVTVDAYLGSISAASARAIILSHIVEGSKNKAALTDGLELTTLAGGTITVTVAGSNVLLASGNASNVPIAVADQAHFNGMGHIIGGVLVP